MKLIGISRQTLCAYESGSMKIKKLETSTKYINKIRKRLVIFYLKINIIFNLAILFQINLEANIL